MEIDSVHAASANSTEMGDRYEDSSLKTAYHVETIYATHTCEHFVTCSVQ